jgi:hypothetical protein
MSERMNPQVKAQWLTALRSGEYEQTTGTLRRIEEYHDEDEFPPVKPVGWCCYGVLCDVAAKSGVKVIRKTDSSKEYFDGAADYLPQVVLEWAGLGDKDPIVREESLADRNDRGVPFVDIANLIEEHL